MSFRVFITGNAIADEALERLRDAGCVVAFGDPHDTTARLAAKLGEFRPDALIVRPGRVTAEVLDAAPGLKVVAKHGVGVDGIDVAAAAARDVPVLFTPGANAAAAAEHTLSLILALTRRIVVEDERLRKGQFDKSRYDGLELEGKTLGCVGFGRIGRRLVELLAPFRMRVLVYEPTPPAAGFPEDVAAASLHDVLAAADVLTLHCPLSPETEGMIDARAIAQMKRGVYMVNTARGGLIVKDDLVAALGNGQVAGAGLDGIDGGPPGAGDPLLSLDNVVLTPHVAGMSDNSYRRMGLLSVDNVLAALRGEPIDPAYVVHP